MNDHISKPIDPAMLFETVGRFYRPVASAGASTATCHSELESPQPAERRLIRAPASDELPSVAGLDTKDGLSRVAGNRKLYLKLLRQFVEQQGPTVRADHRGAGQRRHRSSPSASRTRSKASPETSAPKQCKRPPALWRNSFAIGSVRRKWNRRNKKFPPRSIRWSNNSALRWIRQRR